MTVWSLHTGSHLSLSGPVEDDEGIALLMSRLVPGIGGGWPVVGLAGLDPHSNR